MVAQFDQDDSLKQLVEGSNPFTPTILFSGRLEIVKIQGSIPNIRSNDWQPPKSS
jgi:hypothetical protein